MFDLIFPLLKKISMKALGRAIKGPALDEAKKALTDVLKNDASIRADAEKEAQAFVDYFGKLSDVPKSIQVLRASVRPVTTYLFSIAIFYLVISGRLDWTYLVSLYGPIIGFWFGERNANKLLNFKK